MSLKCESDPLVTGRTSKYWAPSRLMRGLVRRRHGQFLSASWPERWKASASLHCYTKGLLSGFSWKWLDAFTSSGSFFLSMIWHTKQILAEYVSGSRYRLFKILEWSFWCIYFLVPKQLEHLVGSCQQSFGTRFPKIPHTGSTLKSFHIPRLHKDSTLKGFQVSERFHLIKVQLPKVPHSGSTLL